MSVNAGLLHDTKELAFVDLTIAVFVEFIDHGLKFVVRKIFTKLASDSAQVAQTDSAAVVFIKQLEGLQNFLHGVAFSDFVGHNFKEVGILNLASTVAVVLAHQREHFLFLDVESECAHCNFEFVVVDSASLISVEKLKGFADFLLLFV